MLRKLPSYLVLRKFSDPPQLSDLSGFTLDEEDFKQLKNCKPGHCEVQLPSEAMEEFLSTIKIHALPPGATIDVVRRERKLGRLGMSFWIDMGIAALATLCALAAHFAEIGLWAVLYVEGFRTTTWVPLQQRLPESRYHKNIAYRPGEDRLTGLSSQSKETQERLRSILRNYSCRVAEYLSRILPEYARNWRRDYTSFRPFEEQGRHLPLRDPYIKYRQSAEADDLDMRFAAQDRHCHQTILQRRRQWS